MEVDIATQKPILEFDGEKISIFGNTGFAEGDYWTMCVFPGIEYQSNPSSVSSTIEEVIKYDFNTGSLDRIHYMQIDPCTAVMLFLEGKITREAVQAAEAYEDYIVFRGVSFSTDEGEKEFTVVVVEEPHFCYMTMDVNGEVV